MTELNETLSGEIIAHIAFVGGYGLLLAEIFFATKGMRAIRKTSIALGALLLVGAHGYIASRLADNHPYGQALKRQVWEETAVIRKAGEHLYERIVQMQKSAEK